MELLTKLHKVNLFDAVERTGLRYVNLFEGINVFEQSNLKLEIGSRSIVNDQLMLRSERQTNNFKVVTQIVNPATAAVHGSAARTGSIVDIDIVCEKIAVNANDLPADLIRIFVDSNQIADDVFFSLLKPEFIDTFGAEF